MSHQSLTPRLHHRLHTILVTGIVGLLVVALVGFAAAPTGATHGAISDALRSQPCEAAPLAYVSVAGQLEPVREDHAKLFSGADEVRLRVDSAIAGYPAAERHARLFAGADAESLAVDSAIAGYPVSEAHAKLFAGAETEPVTGGAADCPPA